MFRSTLKLLVEYYYMNDASHFALGYNRIQIKMLDGHSLFGTALLV